MEAYKTQLMMHDYREKSRFVKFDTSMKAHTRTCTMHKSED
jgi:hypothetical protein